MERNCKNCAFNFYNRYCLVYNIKLSKFTMSERFCLRWKRLQTPKDIGGKNGTQKKETHEEKD